MTAVEAAQFPAMENAKATLAKLDEHRRRQALAMLAERFGWNLPPATKPVQRTNNKHDRSEFPAIEEAADYLDHLSNDEQHLALLGLTKVFGCTIQPAYKAPPVRFARSPAPKRKRAW